MTPRRFPALATAGLLSLALMLPDGAEAASFDCSAARAADEAAVCSSCDLAQLDVKMATLFEVATHLVAMGQRGDMQDQQRQFLAARSACGADTACLTRAYEGRIRVLDAALKTIYTRGPF